MGLEQRPGSAGPLYGNQLEPGALIDQFSAHPPDGFQVLRLPQATPGFEAEFDLLTTVDGSLKRRIESLPLYRHWSKWLRIRTAFIGTTVSEYALFPAAWSARSLVKRLRKALGWCYPMMIIKDIPQHSPLLDDSANRYAERLLEACKTEGFVLVEGQALAYVPIDFASVEEYLGRLSSSRRKDIRRKWRKREALTIREVPTGDAQFLCDELIDEYYRLYLNVYDQSEIHFDRLSRGFFEQMLRDAGSGGMVFEYCHEDRLIGYNVCFVHDGKLIDKYIGLQYPEARSFNLYFISWLINLDYALSHGLTHYVAGWTDPEIKSYLGASFTFTCHAVYVRNTLLRGLARRFSRYFESDRQWSDSREPAYRSGS
ncbi:GNAT family N-acetyltransferase [Pseudomonas luteola]|uniref:GNAT family N-acetyltransferase n=1 Tax=Pseudomonas luteola TaxID=47886 RepID=UPI003DA0B72C